MASKGALVGRTASTSAVPRVSKAKGGMTGKTWAVGALLVLVLIAWGLRLYRLDAQSLWYDEGVTAQVVRQGLAELTRWTADDIQPPLYYYVVAGWVRLAGSSEWSLRFPSAAWGALIVPLVYVLGRRLVDREVGLLAALLVAVHPLYVYYSQEARMYTQLTALGLLVAYALLRALQTSGTSGRRRWWGLFVIASLAAVYTHYFAFFLLAAFALVVGILLLLHALRSPLPTL
ncbi:MAG: glycosyltransferase family 39 protein, partial [Anaerolineae bacterium]|nr:glycosyltransferase family 39 protein [Anaerolineae bacterium]